MSSIESDIKENKNNVSKCHNSLMFLIVPSENCGYYSLVLCWNSTSGHFLKVNCNIKYETISMDILYPITLKLFGLSSVLSDLFKK